MRTSPTREWPQWTRSGAGKPPWACKSSGVIQNLELKRLADPAGPEPSLGSQLVTAGGPASCKRLRRGALHRVIKVASKGAHW